MMWRRMAPPTPAAPGGFRRVHGLHLAMRRVQRLHGADAEQRFTVPGRPEVDLRCGEARDVEDMGAAGRRHLMACVEMIAEQRDDPLIRQVAAPEFQSHGRLVRVEVA